MKKRFVKKSRFKKIIHDTLRDLYLVSILFMILLIQGFVGHYFNHKAYPTQEIEKSLYTSHLANVKKAPTLIHYGSREDKLIALTFDADMTPAMKKSLEDGWVESFYDSELIEILKSTETRATLFLSGIWIKQYPEESFELARSDLFELGNHSYSHPGFHGDCFGLESVYNFEKEREIEKTQDLLEILKGEKNKLFRFPGGCHSPYDLGLVNKSGQTAVQWDVTGDDGFNYDAESIIRNVVDNVQNGSIIVLHMNGAPYEPATAIALPQIISELRGRGFEFATVSELLEEKQKEVKFVKYLDNNSTTELKLAKR